MSCNNWQTLLHNAKIPQERRQDVGTRRRRRTLRGANKYHKGAPKNTKLTWSKVKKIRKLYFDEDWTVKQLCAEYELSHTAMQNIVSYNSWVPK